MRQEYRPGQYRDELMFGLTVDIVLKQDQKTGKLTRGKIQDILTIIMYLIGFLIGYLLYMAFSGAESTDSKAKSYIVKEATHIAMKNFALNENEEVIFNDHAFDHNGFDVIRLYGYVKSNPEEKREITLAYNNDFSIVYEK